MNKMKTVELCMIWDASFTLFYSPTLALTQRRKHLRSLTWFRDTPWQSLLTRESQLRSWAEFSWSTWSLAWRTTLRAWKPDKTHRLQLGEILFILSNFVKKWCIPRTVKFRKRFKPIMMRRTLEISIWISHFLIGRSLKDTFYISRGINKTTFGLSKNSWKSFLTACKSSISKLEQFLRDQR